jgi:hypothetical protein
MLSYAQLQTHEVTGHELTLRVAKNGERIFGQFAARLECGHEHA